MAFSKRTKAPSPVRPERARPVEPSAAEPSLDSIALRAYEIWRETGSAHGDDQAHWFQAERELRARTARR